ncbi:hypothetical protein K7X08_008649 [Anisodus acutangulus]|uniref:Uncharacterized protein n=1 Tax=Anisodus acutangulus TaxID=402998 RepID=A0A9Q1RTZ3_9SOLA|nr:hypothetical protein K7X08_008649 [Anisodus acutangulus]
MESNGSEWRHMQSIETFGRGGPAPGIGVGWGAPGGGFWSKNSLSAQVDARLFIYLLDVFPIVSVKDQFTTEGMNSIIQKIYSVMGACLLLGPMDSSAVDKLLDFLFQVPTLKYIDFSIRQFLNVNQGFQEEDYLLLSDVLASHFKKKWLSAKRKCKSAAGDEQQVFHKNSKKRSVLLDTIPEEISESIPASQEPKVWWLIWIFLKLQKDDERILEAYCLDKAARRGSASFCHHPFRSKLVKSLLRDYSRKKQHEVVFINLLEYQIRVCPFTLILKEILSSVITRKQHMDS